MPPPGGERRRPRSERGSAMMGYGIVGTIVLIIVIILVLRLLGVI